MKNPLRQGGSGRKRGKQTQSRNHHITKSGNKIKLNRSLIGRMHARKDARLRKKAAYLATLPKGRLKRTLYRLHPKRQFKYWFSRQGGIMALKVAGIGSLCAFLLLVGVFAYFRKDLPNLRDISGNNIGGSIQYYDRTGQVLLWEDYDAVKRTPVKDENISQTLKDATVAIEDKDFFEHGGFDVRGIARAGVSNTIGQGGTQGGSTITQQLVKLTQNWTKDRTYTRKVKELILSVELERSYTKQEILAGYLNTAPYGDITYGVEAAMQDYFKKPAKDATLDEAAFLAAMPQSPTYYSPYGARYDKEALVGRQHYILDLMAQQGKITTEQRDAAKLVDTVATIKARSPKFDGIKAPWFVLTAKEQLLASRPETVKVGGMKVTTTLDMEKQKLGEEQIAAGITRVKRQGGDTAALVAEDVKTGQVVALVGGVDFTNPDFGQNNYARLKLPPGSSYKPYDYAALIEHTTNSGAGSVLYDSPGPLDGYPCTTGPKKGGNCAVNYDFRYPGPLTLRYALGGSRNIPAMKAMLTVGVDKTIETSKKLMQSPGTAEGEARGDYKCYEDDALTKAKPCYTAAAIGDGAFLKMDEHVHGIATISRNGLNIPQTYILKIEDSRGKIVEEWQPSPGVQAIRPEAAYIVADMMSDPKASYLPTKSHNYKGWKFGFKTGTTNDSKDGWMVGMSTQYAVSTWVGYHDRTKELSGFMETMTQPIVAGWMQKAHDNLPPEDRTKPAGLQTLPAFVVRNHVGVSSVEPSPTNDLFPSWYKKTNPNSRKSIDIVSNKLATDCTPPRAKKDVSGASANEFSSDRFNGTGGANTSEKDDIHRCQDAKPSVTLATNVSGANITITATGSQGTHPISSNRFVGKINLLVDGNIVKSFDIGSSPSTFTHTYASGLTGNHEVSAQIIDSVLYDAADTRTVDFGAPTPVSGIISLSAKLTGSNSKFTWTGGTGTVTVYRVSNNQALCNSGPSSNCSVVATLAPPPTEVIAKDTSNGISNITTVAP
ncbi:MAG: transglycosylase domain-containing protein [Candidatus Saccharimonadales bacterium]